MQITVISDTHGLHKNIRVPEGDILIHCGDAELCDWARYHSFLKWFKSLPHKMKIFVPGNHDFLIQDYRFNCSLEFESNGIHCLIDRRLEIDGIKFYGSPWTPTFNDWAFMKDDLDLAKHWDAIPNDTNILITHGPAYTIGDRVENTKDNLGSKTLLSRLVNLSSLHYHFFGHIHTGKDCNHSLGFKSINCSILNEKYQINYDATEVSIDK